MQTHNLLKEIHAETARFILYTVYDTMYLHCTRIKPKKSIFVQLMLVAFHFDTHVHRMCFG